MTSDETITLLETAFADVRLEGGMSLRQAELADDMSYHVDSRWDEVRKSDVVDDWRRIPDNDLEDLPYLAHIDAAGFRYYIPALLRLLARAYDPGELYVIQIFSALCPTQDRWDFCMWRYSLLTDFQKRAIAGFLVALPSIANLDSSDIQIVRNALAAYWCRYLTPYHEG